MTRLDDETRGERDHALAEAQRLREAHDLSREFLDGMQEQRNTFLRERNQARVALERVRAVADEWESSLAKNRNIMTTAQANTYRNHAEQIRTALGSAGGTQ